MAVGHLLDYRRFVAQPQKLAVLLPVVPRPDLIEFLHSNSIVVLRRRSRGVSKWRHLPMTLEHDRIASI
jgi:hypothetical protein